MTTLIFSTRSTIGKLGSPARIPMLVAGLLFLAGAADVAGQERAIDVGALQAHGLEVVRSEHLTMITDARGREDVRQFNEVFEKAVHQWCDYFAIPRLLAEDWHVTACVMLDSNKFDAAGLLSDSLPPFPAGYQLNQQIWMYVQEGDYYSRHLLLHEGTHAFMEKFLGGYGAAWYAEGMAELLAIHQWKDGTLRINHPIATRDDVPYWGRVKLIRKDRDAGNGLTLDEALAISPGSFRQVRYYGWAWAVCEFFDKHPDFRATFLKLPSLANGDPDDFSRQFRAAISPMMPEARRQWEMMIDEIDYGYDVASSRIEPVVNRQTVADGVTFDLATNRGWQATGIEVQSGVPLKIAATGRFRIKSSGGPWPCEAGGVTLEYYRGRPLGRLIAAVETGDSQTPTVVDVGLGGDIVFPQTGRLLMRVNESPASWRDNQGVLSVRVDSTGK